MTYVFPRTPFYFLRHGVTDHNQRRVVMGQRDIPLNDLGRRQARQAAESLQGVDISRVVTSPLSRARETAEIIAEALGLDLDVVDGFKERDWGEMAGRSYRELMQAQTTPAGAETTEAFSARVLSALEEVSLAASPLLVSHSGMCRVLRRCFALTDDRKAVPNAVPILFAPNGTGGWTETILAMQAPDDIPLASGGPDLAEP